MDHSRHCFVAVRSRHYSKRFSDVYGRVSAAISKCSCATADLWLAMFCQQLT